MKNLLKPLLLSLVSLLVATSAAAQATRTWVSGVGDDANPCSRTAPCKTFAGAISKTATNGIINVLDPGGFGAVTITKSITIDGTGSLAGVLVSGTNAINVSGANVMVTLRNLSIEGVNTGLAGINVIGMGAYVSVENCRIFGFNGTNGTGIRVTQPATLVVKDSEITDNGIGVQINTASGNTTATLDGVLIQGHTLYGVEVLGAGTVSGSIRRSSIVNNSSVGAYIHGSSAQVSIVDSMLSQNFSYAILAGAAGSRVRISGNSIFNSADNLGIASGAFIESDNTNRFAGTTSTLPNATFANH